MFISFAEEVSVDVVSAALLFVPVETVVAVCLNDGFDVDETLCELVAPVGVKSEKLIF